MRKRIVQSRVFLLIGGFFFCSNSSSRKRRGIGGKTRYSPRWGAEFGAGALSGRPGQAVGGEMSIFLEGKRDCVARSVPVFRGWRECVRRGRPVRFHVGIGAPRRDRVVTHRQHLVGP